MENLETAIAAVNKFIFFGWNFPQRYHEWENAWGEKKTGYLPNFIIDADWNCSTLHMIDKWHILVKHYDGDAPLIAFYAELSGENRRALIEWVMDNYDNEIKI